MLAQGDWCFVDTLQDGLVGIVNIVNIHDHTVGTAASLGHLRPSDDVHLQFENYFDSGLGISEALRHHIDNLLCYEDGTDEVKLVDGSRNPKYSTVRYWFDQWRLTNLGPRTGEKLLDVCHSVNITC